MSSSPLDCWLARPLNRVVRRRVRQANRPTPKSQLHVEKLEDRACPSTLLPSTFSGEVYGDTNHNGVIDSNEGGLAGVTVILTGTDLQNNPISATTTTALNGTYTFAKEPPGTYQLTEIAPAGYTNGIASLGHFGGVGGNGTVSQIVVPGCGCPASGYNFAELPVAAPVGTANPNGTTDTTGTAGTDLVGLGDPGTASLSGNVYLDLNDNGLIDPGEQAVAGVTITLEGTTNSGASVSLTTTSAADGTYSFNGLSAGTYSMVQTQPSNYTYGRDEIGTQGGVKDINTLYGINLGAGVVGTGNNFAERVLGSTKFELDLAGYVYTDCNGNGVKDGNEPGLADVTLTLRSSEGYTQTATTDQYGAYIFPEIPAGTYTLTEVQPAGYLPDIDSVGTEYGGTVGPFGSNTISNIVMPAGNDIIAENYNFGNVIPGTINGNIYLDANNDGRLDNGESGIAGVTLTLTGVNDLNQSITASTTTDSSGNYAFQNLRPGTYNLTETTPPNTTAGKDLDIGTGGGLRQTSNTITGITFDGCAGGATGYNFGHIPQASPNSISGYVYVDCNVNGVKDAGEQPVAGVTLTVLGTPAGGGVGTFLVTLTTDANGHYEIDNLAPGTYTISEAQPAGFLPGPESIGTPFTATIPQTGEISVVIPSGDTGVAGTNYNFAEYDGQLTGFVYQDLNNNGVKDAGEPGIAGVTVTLTGTNNLNQSVSLVATTGSNGLYNFGLLQPGTYKVTETPPAGYSAGTDTVGTPFGGTAPQNNTIVNIAVDGCDLGNGYNFGETKPTPVPASIAGFVYVDCNVNGVKDAGETAVPGTTVYLETVSNGVTTTVGSTTTDSNGAYSFTNVAAGTYQLAEVHPANYLDGPDSAGTPFGGTGGAIGTDLISNIVVPTSTTAAAGTNYDFAEYDGQLTGYVYQDLNTNGVKDAGEPGIAGVTVTLTGTNNLNQSVSLVATTGSNGLYNFGLLQPGTYKVTETPPAGYTAGTDAVGTPFGGTAPQNNTIVNIAVDGCDLGTGYNFGEVNPTSVTDSIAGSVYVDCNVNGVKDAGEQGVAGVTIGLAGVLANGQDFGTEVTTTDANGNYVFSNLPAGTYQITETQPVGYFNGPLQIGTPFAATTPQSNEFNIVIPSSTTAAAGTNYNFAEYDGKLTGYVYLDTNNNGVKDAGEPGIAGVTVTLTGTNNLNQPVTMVATTGSDGSYNFGTLRPGTYKVTETAPAGYAAGTDTVGTPFGGTAPQNNTIVNVAVDGCDTGVGYNFGEVNPTPVSSSIAGFVYVDCNVNGVKDAGEQAVPGTTVLLESVSNGVTTTVGSTTTDVNGAYSFGNVAAGNYQLAEVQPANFLSGPESVGTSFGGTAGAIGTDLISNIVVPSTTVAAAGTNYNFAQYDGQLTGFVYFDANNNGVKDAGEAGIAGATVALTGTNDLGQNVSLVTTTGSNGLYNFGLLRPGTYKVSETVPAGYIEGTDAVGTPFGGTAPQNGTLVNVAVDGCDTGVGYNFGEKTPPQTPLNSVSGKVFEDCDDNGIFDGVNQGIAGVTLTLTGTSTTGTAVSATATTDANGNYTFTGLAAGTYQVTEAQPAGYLEGKDSVGTPFGGNNATQDILASIVIPSATTAATGANYNFAEVKPSDLSGYVYLDANDDGILQSTESQIKNVTITLTGTNDLGQSISLTTITGQVPGQGIGYYDFSNLRPGTYAIVETPPPNLFTGKDTIGTQGGITSPNRFDITLPGCTVGTDNNFGELVSGVNASTPLANISGYVYFDHNVDGVYDNGDTPLTGVTVVLTGTSTAAPPLGGSITQSTTTDANGFYEFTNLPPGTYTVHEVEPGAQYIDSGTNVGTPFGGTVPSHDYISNVTIPDNVVDGTTGVNYDFGEFQISKQQFLASSGSTTATTTGVLGETITSETFSPLVGPVTVTGSQDSSIVRVQSATTGATLAQFYAFDPSFSGGVRVALADVNGDGYPDIIAAAGPGGGPEVRIFSGLTGKLIGDFFAFAPNFTGGVTVAVADVNGDGTPDIILGAGAGGGPHVKVVNGKTLDINNPLASFFAFDSTSVNFSKGVNVAGGDLTGNGKAEVIVGAGAGGTPEVRTFQIASGAATMTGDFQAYDSTDTGGVFVAAGKVQGGSTTDIVTGAGSGLPEVKVFNGKTLQQIEAFEAYATTFTGGVRVAVTDLNGDGFADIVTSPGATGGPDIRVFSGATGLLAEEYFAADPTSTGGQYIGAFA